MLLREGVAVLNIWKMLAGITLLVLLSGLVVRGVNAPRRVALRKNEGLLVALPAVLSGLRHSSARIAYFYAADRSETAEVLYQAFERPLFFVPGIARGEFICVFEFDVGLRLVVFDVKRKFDKLEMTPEARVMVLASEMSARDATAEERKYVRETLAAMDDTRFRELSVPSLRLGPLWFYAKRANLLQRL
jgi:hypothetical protein